MKEIIKKTGIQYGLILGLIFALFSVYIHLVDTELIVNVWAGFFTLLLNVAIGIFAILAVKKQLGGLIVFKDAFSTYFLTVLVGSAINVVVLLLLYYVILSPEKLEALKQLYINFNVKMINQNFAQAENLNEIIEQYKLFNPFVFSEVVIAAAKFLLRDCLIGFLVALIMRNQKAL